MDEQTKGTPAKLRFYTEDYKRQVVDLVTSTGRTASSVAAEVGLHHTLVSRWIRRYGQAKIGLDTAKTVFQVHGVDEEGRAKIKRKLRRTEVIGFFEAQPGCTVVLEACGAAHHWGRVLGALGHEVKLVPPEAVRPFVKRGKKNDAADAAAICEAARRPEVKFVPVKSVEQQGVLALHTARALLVKQQTMLANALRGLAAEFGLVVPQGLCKLEALMELVDTQEQATLPEAARQGLRVRCWHRASTVNFRHKHGRMPARGGAGTAQAGQYISSMKNGLWRTRRHGKAPRRQGVITSDAACRRFRRLRPGRIRAARPPPPAGLICGGGRRRRPSASSAQRPRPTTRPGVPRRAAAVGGGDRRGPGSLRDASARGRPGRGRPLPATCRRWSRRSSASPSACTAGRRVAPGTRP